MNWANKIFIGIFLIILCLPYVFLNTYDKLKLPDNRHAAAKTDIFQQSQNGISITSNFQNKYEAWFNDRLGGRMMALKANGRLQHINRHLRQGGSYIANDWFVGNPSRKKPSDKLSQKFHELKKWCGDRKIKCYVAITPDKNFIYADKTLGIIPDKWIDLGARIKKIADAASVPIVYPLTELQELRRTEDVFYRTDHHMTDSGQYIFYSAIIKMLGKDFKGIPIAGESDFHISKSTKVRAEQARRYGLGSACGRRTFGTKNWCENQTATYKFYDHKNSGDLRKNIADQKLVQFVFHYPKGFPKRVVVLGNSITESLMQFLPYSFRDTMKIRYSSIEDPRAGKLSPNLFENEIMEFRPDIMIIITDAGGQHLEQLMDK